MSSFVTLHLSLSTNVLYVLVRSLSRTQISPCLRQKSGRGRSGYEISQEPITVGSSSSL